MQFCANWWGDDHNEVVASGSTEEPTIQKMTKEKFASCRRWQGKGKPASNRVLHSDRYTPVNHQTAGDTALAPVDGRLVSKQATT